jgi:hypothetical protein
VTSSTTVLDAPTTAVETIYHDNDPSHSGGLDAVCTNALGKERAMRIASGPTVGIGKCVVLDAGRSFRQRCDGRGQARIMQVASPAGFRP